MKIIIVIKVKTMISSQEKEEPIVVTTEYEVMDQSHICLAGFTYSQTRRQRIIN